jgi:hypothetical protein
MHPKKKTMENQMKSRYALRNLAFYLTTILSLSLSAWAAEPAKKSVAAPNGQTISVEMIGPVTQSTDLQIICVLKHDPAGDKYIEAMDDLNQKLHRILSNLRERGEFAGELGETLLITPPAGSITPKQLLLIGIGEESAVSLDRLTLVGGIAARESARLKAANVSFAPTLRDQGSTRVDVGDGDGAFTRGWILAYDTEAKLRSQNLAPATSISSLTIEAGPKYFEGAAAKVAEAVTAAGAAIQTRDGAPYASK